MPTGVSPLVPVLTQIGFASTPLASPQTWTDVSDHVRTIDIDRGRQHELNAFEPGRARLILRNTDRLFDPDNTSGTYYGNLDLNKQLQVLATWNHLSSAAGGTTMSGGWTGGTNTTVSYVAGKLRLTRTTSIGDATAQTATGTGGFKVLPGRVYSIIGLSQAAVTLRASDVAITWYTAAGSVISTTTGADLNDAVVSAVQISLLTATAPATAAFAAITLTNKACAVSETHDWSQVGVFPIDSLTTWQPGGGAALYTGFIDSIAPQYPDQVNSDTAIACTDALRLLQGGKMTFSTYAALILADGAIDFWQLSETSGTTAADSGANAATLSLVGQAYAWNQVGPGIVAPPSAVSISNGTYFSIPFLTTGINFTGAHSYELSFKIPTTPITNMPLLGIADSGSASENLYVDTSGHLRFDVYTFPSVTLTLAGATNVADNVWHHVVVSVGSDGRTTAIYLDGGTETSGTASAAHVTATSVRNLGASADISGTVVTAGTQNGTLYLSGVGFFNSQLSGAQAVNHLSRARYGWTQQDSGARISAVLTAMNWPAAYSNIATGDSQVQAPTSDLTQSSILSYLQTVETAEHGFLFVNASGVLTFINRLAIYKAPRNTSNGTFGENAGECHYLKGPSFARDNIDFFNQSQVTRTGGLRQVWNDAASQSQYGSAPSYNESGLLITTDAEALARAQWNVDHYKTPVTRTKQISVNPLGEPGLRFNQILFRDLTDRITIKRRPYKKTDGTFGSPTFTQDYFIEGISHSINFDKRTWKTNYNLSPVDSKNYWILGDSVLGILDSTTRLAY